MSYKYYHDKDNKIVYRAPEEPLVSEKFDKKQNIISWNISMEIDIARSDNVLLGNNWKYQTMEFHKQIIENIGDRYDREKAISFFQRRHVPKADEINQETYENFKKKYEEEAKKKQMKK